MIGGVQYHNPSFGLATKPNGKKNLFLLDGKMWSVVQLKSHIHIYGSVRKCEAMNSHTPKWIPILRVEILMNSQIFKKRFEGQNSLN
jgi:hypothetical protein